MKMRTADDWFNSYAVLDEHAGNKQWDISTGDIEDIQYDAAVAELSNILGQVMALNDGHDWPVSRLIRKRILEIEILHER